MIQEPPSKSWIVLIVAIISTSGVICAAIIGLGLPFAQKYADRYFDQTPLSPPPIQNETPTPILSENDALGTKEGDTSSPLSSKFKMESTEKTGPGNRVDYEVMLVSDEVIVGDAYDFQDKGHTCVVFIIQGPGSFQFSVLDGGWNKYSGVDTPSESEELLQDRIHYLEGHWFCKALEIPIEKIGE